MSTVSWPKCHRELRSCLSLCVILTPSIKVRWMKKQKSQNKQLVSMARTFTQVRLMPSLNIFPLIFPPSLPLSVSPSDLLFMPVVTLEALWIPGECEISLAGQQPGRRQTLASSCGTHQHFLLVVQRGSAARVQKFGQASAKSSDGNSREDTDSSGQSGLLRLDHKRKMKTD